MEAREDTVVVLFLVFFFFFLFSSPLNSQRHAKIKTPPLDKVTQEGLPGKVTLK